MSENPPDTQELVNEIREHMTSRHAGPIAGHLAAMRLLERAVDRLAQQAQAIEQLTLALRMTRAGDDHTLNCKVPQCRACSDWREGVVNARCDVLNDLRNPIQLTPTSFEEFTATLSGTKERDA